MSPSDLHKPLLEVKQLSKHFGAVEALNDFSMKVYPGEVVALAGDNGAGKTTVIKAISGVYKPTGGKIMLGDEEVDFSTPQEARDKGIETIYQDMALAANLSIGATIFLGREPMRRMLGLIPVLDRKKMNDAAKETMALLDFHVSRMEAPVANFSGGQRQAVAIGRAVFWDAQILIMDEPTAGLDPNQIKQFRENIQKLGRTKTLLISTHILQEVEAMASRVILIDEGRVVYDGPATDLDKNGKGMEQAFYELTSTDT